MKQSFGHLASDEQAFLYTISCGKLTATVTDFGAHLVSLLVPNRNGDVDDVVLRQFSGSSVAGGTVQAGHAGVEG